MKSTFLDADEVAEVTAAISRVGFSSDVELELITKINDLSLEEGSSSKLQDFTMMPSYFKQSTWDKANPGRWNWLRVRCSACLHSRPWLDGASKLFMPNS